MKKLKSIFLCLLCAFFMAMTNVARAVACTSFEIDTGSGCVDSKFTITTTSLSANRAFKFVLSATGTFYVDWGDGTVDTITRNDTTPTEYSHTFTVAGVKTIRFGGVATGYNTTTYQNDKDPSGAAIRFSAVPTKNNPISTNTGGTPTWIASLSGSIGSVFPTLGNASGQIPTFFELCHGCTNLTTISGDLFTGVTGATKNMFRSVFDKCSSLTNIPDGLFGDSSGSAVSMFRSAFYECASLRNIPEDLFANINGGADSMFKYTFYRAGTTSPGLLDQFIPPHLFDGAHGQSPNEFMMNIFNESGLLTSCPSGTTQYITGYESLWGGKVACVRDECQGATYEDNNVCVDCPAGYDYNTTAGKTSIDECTIHCSAGTWTGEYMQLEYLEGTGTQYINTGHVVSSTSLSADFEISSGVNVSGDIGHFAGNQDALNGHASNFKGSVFGLWVQDGSNGTKITTGGVFNANVRKRIHYDFNGNKRTLTVDNSSNANKTFSGSIISNNPYRLFSNGCAGGCNDKMLVGRMHWFKLYEQSNLVLDMIPVRRLSDNALGMYDRVSGTLFTNSGTGDFVAGPNVSVIGGSVCEDVGHGFYSDDTVTAFGYVSQRDACPSGFSTFSANATDISECEDSSGHIVCPAGTYIPAESSSCVTCPGGSWCPGGILQTNAQTDQGISSCATAIGANWSSEQGSDSQTDCYYLITLDKNGYTGVINANAGIGCTVVSTANGTTNATLKLFYNTGCTLPAINLTKVGFSDATSWSDDNLINSNVVTTISPQTSTPTTTRYYAQKLCPENKFASQAGTACSACGANSSTPNRNAAYACTCDTGYSADGTVNGATTSINGCLEKSLTCQSNEFKYIDANSNEACIENKFQITTTNDTDEFVFNMSAKGTFYIDWGDGTVELIDRSNTTTMTEYSHNYASADEYIIKFGGVATEYIRGDSNGYYNNVSCIYFGEPVAGDPANVGRNNTNDKLAEISGSLGALFPTLGTGYANQPRFTSTFRNCTNLQGIPATLFNGITGTATTNMFTRTFYGCSGLRGTNIDDPANPGMKYAIPPNLFSGLSSAPNGGTFYMTFYGCSGLNGTIPGSLFNISSITPTQSVFHSTFAGCSSLTGPIPSNLFANVSGKAGNYAFYYAFQNCSSLSGTNIDDSNNTGMKYAIPPTLFSGITNLAVATFQGTFYNCSGLTGSIPGNLFSGIYGKPVSNMFQTTFYGCSGLTGSIPGALFSGISGAPASNMFYQTFRGCSGLTGPIPGNLFSGISGTPATSMFQGTFYGCSGLTATDTDDPNNPGMKYAIPPTLFSGISGAPATNMFETTFYDCNGLTGAIPGSLFQGVSGEPRGAMFSQTFRGCTNLTRLPQGLFSGISGAPAGNMFNSTFNDCRSLTGTISDDFFGNIIGVPASSMFYYTFNGCRNLTGPIPEKLFSGIYGKAINRAFGGTFNGCTNLGKDTIGGTSTYYIPPELFAGIDKDSTATEFMNVIFSGTGLLTTCPAGTSQYITGFESYFSGKKSCTQCSVNYPNYDTTNDQCYAQITYIDSDNNTLLKTEDVYYDANYPNGYTLPSYSPTKPDTVLDNWENGAGTVIGANDVLTGNQVLYSDWAFNCDSGRHFHIANEQVCVAESKRTEHALAIQVDPEHTYYIHATPNSEHDYTINSSSIHKLKADYNGTIYNLHDASVYFSE